MLVVDTSAVLELLASERTDVALLERVSRDGDLHAPHLIDIEFAHALRGLLGRRELSLDRANEARRDFADLTITRYPHHPLADRIWALRSNLTAYDAAFIALAEELASPLITCDGKLRRIPRSTASVEVFRPR